MMSWVILFVSPVQILKHGRTGFQYKREYDPKSGAVKSVPIGPNSQETVYEMAFNEKNFKTLYDKRITPEDLKLCDRSAN